MDWREGDSNGKGGGKGKVRLVQRSPKASLMASMWELPQTSVPPRRSRTDAHWRTFRHSITVTNYTVHVLRNKSSRDLTFPDTEQAAKGKWIEVDRIQQLPITGLTRKILKASDII